MRGSDAPAGVLVLNQFALPRSAPGGTRHVELFGRLQRFRAVVVAGNRDLLSQRPVRAEGMLRTVPVTRYSSNGISRLVNWMTYTVGATAYGIVQRPRPAVVVGSSPQMGAALAGLVVATVRRARFVLEVRDLWPDILIQTGKASETGRVFRVLKRLERFLYRRADAIIVLAEGSVEPVVREGGAPERVCFIPNGADPEDFEVETDRTVLRDDLGFEGFVCVYAGAHGPANGLRFVLDAAGQLADELPDVRFVLVGDGIEKPDLEAEAHRRQLHNVEFRDPVPKQEISAIFAAADVGVHCLDDLPLFRHGVSPNKLYDYMAAGLPALTNTLGEVAAIVHESGAGVAVAPDDLAGGVRTLHAMSDAQRRALGDHGRAYVRAHRSRAAMAGRLEAVLTGVVERRPGPW